MQDHVSRLVGLDGFRVMQVIGDGDRLEIEVELVERARSCPYCAGTELEVHERPVVAVRDLPFAGRSATLWWRKRRYRCKGCRRTHTESCEQAPPRQRVTRRFRARLAERARSGGAHAEIAREERTTRYHVSRAMRIAAAQAIWSRSRALPRRLSFDEAAHRKGSKDLATVVSDLDRKRVHEVLDGRTRHTVERFLGSLTDTDRDGVEVVCIDLYEPYRQAISAGLPRAQIVADPFHVVRGAGEALDTVRRSRQREAGRRGPQGRRARRSHWRPEFYRARHLLLRGRERLTERQRRRLCDLFTHDPLIAEAWGLREALRAVYHAGDRREAELLLNRFFADVERSRLPPFQSYAKGIAPWRMEILAYFDQPASNGYAEGVINKVKVIKRRAYGLPTFQGFRERVLIACG
jgi:transposase